jgi:hypothetical protein
MKRLLLAIAAGLLLVSAAAGQNYTPFTASNITDGGGNKLASGQVSVLGTDGNDIPVNYGVGGGGMVTKVPFTATVTNGAVAGGFQVPNSINTNPAGIKYRVQVKCLTGACAGLLVVDLRLVTINGATFSLDAYQPNVGNITPPSGSSITGPFTVTGNATVTGTLTVGALAGVWYQTLQSAGVDIAQRAKANFKNGLQCVDNVSISDCSPVYGTASNTVAQGNDSRILNAPDKTTSADYTEIATPGTSPSAGFLRVYAKTGDLWCFKTSGGTERCNGGIVSVFGRFGTVVATTGDYTAAQVTNADDITVANDWTEIATPGTSPAAGKLRVYAKTTTEQLCIKNSAAAETCYGGAGAVTSVFGRTGVVVAAANDYTWAQLAAGTGTNLTLDFEGTGNHIKAPSIIWLPGGGCNNAAAAPFWDLPTSTPAVAACVTGTNTQKGVLDYADTAGGFSAQTTALIPSDFTGTVDMRLIWLTSAITGNAKWTVSWSCTDVAATATDDAAFTNSTTATTAAPGTTLRLQTSTMSAVTLTGCSAGNMLHLKVFRDGNDAADTIAATARFYGLEIKMRRTT